jgi:tRNA-intron endonuclease, archaea type
MLELEYVSKGKIIVTDQSSRDILRSGFIGIESKKSLDLGLEEALYLIDVRNALCKQDGKQMTFNEIASKFWKTKKFAARYFTYKDWRDRGLIIRDADSKYKEPDKTPVKEYPASSLSLPNYKLHGTFYETDLMPIIDEKEKGKELYEKSWFGQYGAYKAADRGQLNKLDVYETLFLIEEGMLSLDNITKQGLIDTATARRSDFPRLYEVYKDWRSKGYVIKTGFKFGTHFRLYFPGARPVKEEAKDWVHSKHVIQVFPKESKLLISEWARAIRVAHSVRKTFILAVPGNSDDKKVKIDYILYHRKGGDAENPENCAPRYAMLSLSEEEYIGGREFAGAIREAKNRRLELIIAIADRETAVTYYRIRQIKLPGSKHEYYEIDWLQP